jgi:hypothetical protein
LGEHLQRAKELSFCFVVYLAKDSIFRLRRGLGAVGEKHTTAAGWEAISLDNNTNAGKSPLIHAELQIAQPSYNLIE